MTQEQIDKVLTRVRSWPAERQQDAARILLAIEEQDASPYRLSPEEHAEIDAALEEVTRGEVASDEEVAALFDRFRK